MSENERPEWVEALARCMRTGKFFTVAFRPRTPGKPLRTMTCRAGVKKFANGGGLAFDPGERGLLQVWDTVAKGYRFIPIEGIVSITAFKEKHDVKNEKLG